MGIPKRWWIYKSRHVDGSACTLASQFRCVHDNKRRRRRRRRRRHARLLPSDFFCSCSRWAQGRTSRSKQVRTKGRVGAMASTEAGEDVAVVFCTVPDKETGRKIASELLSQKLVACVNMIPGVESMKDGGERGADS